MLRQVTWNQVPRQQSAFEQRTRVDINCDFLNKNQKIRFF